MKASEGDLVSRLDAAIAIVHQLPAYEVAGLLSEARAALVGATAWAVICDGASVVVGGMTYDEAVEAAADENRADICDLPHTVERES